MLKLVYLVKVVEDKFVVVENFLFVVLKIVEFVLVFLVFSIDLKVFVIFEEGNEFVVFLVCNFLNVIVVIVIIVSVFDIVNVDKFFVIKEVIFIIEGVFV